MCRDVTERLNLINLFSMHDEVSLQMVPAVLIGCFFYILFLIMAGKLQP